MTASVIELSWLDLGISALLMLVAGGISLALGLGLEKKLLWASIRTVAQLLLVGQVLHWVFDLSHPAAIIGILVVMIAAAGGAATNRPSRTYRGSYIRSFFALFVTALLTTFSVTAVIVGVEPWYRAQYVIPLCGMILGNGLNGISLCIDRLLENLAERKERIEADIALGATRWEAARAPVRDAVRNGMIPIINSMMIVGIVSLPGMMTGQILAGADPLDAVKYQIVVMFMLAAATSLGCILVAAASFRVLFDEAHRLRHERILDRE